MLLLKYEKIEQQSTEVQITPLFLPIKILEKVSLYGCVG